MASSKPSVKTEPLNVAVEPKTIGRRERSKLEKRTRIIAAARELFRRQGFTNTTTQQIADAADIGTGTLFLYAKTKEDLLLMVFKDEMMANAQHAFDHLPSKGTAVDQLMYVFESMVEYHSRDLDMAVILYREIIIPRTPERYAELQGLLDTILNGLENIVRSGQKSNQIAKSLDPRPTAQSIFSIYQGGLISWLSKRYTGDQFLSDLRNRFVIFAP